MYYIGGLGIGTEMMSYNSIGGKQSFKIQVEHLGIDDHDMVALFNMFMDYETRFTPSYLTVKALSSYVIRLVFEDGFTVVCSQFQKFFMYDYTWKMAKDLTCEDKFFQVFRDPDLFECRGDFNAEDHEFNLHYVPDDIKLIKLKSSETLPTDKAYELAVPIDWHSNAIVLANGAVVEGVCLLGHPAQKTKFDAPPKFPNF